MSVKIEKISGPLTVGEAPHWDARAQALYFVDVSAGALHKYMPATGSLTKAIPPEGRPGFIVPVEGHLDQFVVGLGREFAVLRWGGEEGGGARVLRRLAEVDAHAPRNRLNDGKADPRGRLFAGTMGPAIDESEPYVFEPGAGALYRLDPAGATRLCGGVTISNGLAWDLARRALYYIDTVERNIRRYDYDVDTGHISNLRYIFDFDKTEVKGGPDGATIDTDGNLWVAVFGGSCVLQISPEGKLLRRLALPAEQVTSCTFGGADLDQLFVTTACVGLEQTPARGCTYQVSGLGARGHPGANVKLP